VNQKKYELAGFLFTAVAGTMLHFVYAWSGYCSLAAAFAPVNESVWEHMKLLFIPVFVFSMIQFLVRGRAELDGLAARGISALAGTALIPVLYYTYTGILGRDWLWMDLVIFYTAAAGTFWLNGSLRRKGALLGSGWQVLGFLLLWGMLFLMIWCTFRPPHLPMWRDPVTGGYGIPAAMVLTMRWPLDRLPNQRYNVKYLFGYYESRITDVMLEGNREVFQWLNENRSYLFTHLPPFG
jgi:hypothetical protein